ncbi:MAG TPA: DUF6079 family protein [Blastocatellia bacterium]|nr:DUF6079 family protein [Blastocatellia bacterium]
MAKQIKAYVEVEPYDEISPGRGTEPAALAGSVLVAEDFGRALARLAESAVGATASARVLSGPHGVGKSTLLALIHAIASEPATFSRSPHQDVRSASGLFAELKVVPVFIDPSDDPSSDFASAVRKGFVAAANSASRVGISAADWDGACAAPDPADQALALLPSGVRLLLLVDGASSWIRSVERDVARGAMGSLAVIADRAQQEPVSLIIALDEETLDGGSGLALPLLRSCQVEYLPAVVLFQACDRHLFKKAARQRAELGNLYNELKSSSPAFRWTREEFVGMYPLHPATVEVASALSRYAPSFSFLRFASAAGNRAKGRRELSLIVLDELFDTCEYELRKEADLADVFEIYDDFVNNVVPRLTDSQHRFWAKLVLKGLFLCSLSGRAVSAAELADTMMLRDESNPQTGARTVQSILTNFEERAAQRFTIEGEGDSRTYRLPTAADKSGSRVVATLAQEIGEDDPRLADMLVRLGASRFPDWPVIDPDAGGRAELEIPWRGTWRRGLLSYRIPVELAVIPPLKEDYPPSAAEIRMEFDGTTGSGEDGSDANDVETEPATERRTVRFTPAESICEFDWEVQLVPLGAPVELRDGPTTLVLWIPGEPDDDDLGVLRRLTVLRSDDPRLEAAGVDREALAADVEAEGGLVFHRLYLEKGRFVGPDWELRSAEQAARETTIGLLARVLEAPISERFPEHPLFTGELDEAAVHLLIEKLFVGGAGTPNVQQAAATLAAPLGLAEAADGGQYRFNPNGETALAHSFNVEPLRLAEAAGDTGVPLEAFYQALRREPFGLQRIAQRLILAGLVGSGRLKLIGPDCELTAIGLSTAGDLQGYTHMCRAGLAVYPNETLLEWARLVSEVDDLDDLVTAEGRQLVRQALESWLDRWHDMDLKARFNEVPDEAATRRTWQLISASKQYFDTTARSVESVLIEEISLEEGIGRIVTTFAAKPAIYQRATRDLKMLTSFVEWVPYYSEAKEYILSADRTPEPSIEAERAELIDFITAPHRLLEETKRRRFETVYESFQQHYADYYTSSHDLHVGSRADFDALSAYLDSETWARFELLSQVRVVNSRYYQFALEFVSAIRDLSCDLPTRELLHDRPLCLCGFRLGNTDGVARMCERLRMIVEQGTTEHIQTIRQFRQTILIGMRTMDADAAYADASVPLISLLSGGEKIPEITPSTVELINNCVAGQPAPVVVSVPPALEPGLAITKQDLRMRLMAWLEELPGDDGVVFEVSRLLPASADE